MWHDGAVLVLQRRTGGGVASSTLPGLAEAAAVEVTVRSKDRRAAGRLGGRTSAVLAPGAAARDAAAAALHGERLNAHDGDAQPDRWAWDCVIVRIGPARAIAHGAGLPAAPAAAPVPSPAKDPRRRTAQLLVREAADGGAERLAGTGGGPPGKSAAPGATVRCSWCPSPYRRAWCCCFRRPVPFRGRADRCLAAAGRRVRPARRLSSNRPGSARATGPCRRPGPGPAVHDGAPAQPRKSTEPRALASAADSNRTK
ncbi:hypothetical protein ACU686_07535 [Yinghuangia aomiensis]